ncbi:hypothetical protein A4G20_05880 [Pasteurellaceae bacterium RH1A]|nr:hypothetical protein A4G20_05880 [Pasteurellaceae bacterium RH1A]
MNNLPVPYTDSQRNYMLAIYVLFGLSVFVGGLTAVVGVIMAYVKRQEMQGTIYQDHIAFLFRTFWVTALGLIAGAVLSVIGIGFLVIFAIGAWYIFRVVIGLIRFFEDKSVTPTGYFM